MALRVAVDRSRSLVLSFLRTGAVLSTCEAVSLECTIAAVAITAWLVVDRPKKFIELSELSNKLECSSRPLQTGQHVNMSRCGDQR